MLAQQPLDPFELGGRVGLNYAGFVFWDIDQISDLKTGLSVAGFVKFRLSNWIAIQPELLYSQEGGVYNGARIDLNYLLLPVLLKIYPVSRFVRGLSIQLGPQIDFLTSATMDQQDAQELFTSTNWTIILGLGYEFNSGLLLTFRYHEGMANVITPEYQESIAVSGSENQLWYKAHYSLSLGWRF